MREREGVDLTKCSLEQRLLCNLGVSLPPGAKRNKPESCDLKETSWRRYGGGGEARQGVSHAEVTRRNWNPQRPRVVFVLP